MKPKSLFTLRQSTRASAVGIMFASTVLPVAAESLYWNGVNDGTTSWANILNWSTNLGATSPNPTTGEWAKSDDDVFFNISTVNTAQVIHLNDTAQAANSLTFNSTGTTYINSDATGTNTTTRNLSLGSGGLTVSSGAGPSRSAAAALLPSMGPLRC